jgi:hypothetical protein
MVADFVAQSLARGAMKLVHHTNRRSQIAPDRVVVPELAVRVEGHEQRQRPLLGGRHREERVLDPSSLELGAGDEHAALAVDPSASRASSA